MKQSTWKILKWITKWLTPHKSYASSLDYWENTINRWLATQGNLNTMKRIKAIRLHCTRYMCGKPLLKSAHPGVGINAKGLPKALGPIQDLIHGDEWDKRFLLTLLSLSRCIECSGTVSTQDITDVGVAIPSTVIDEHLKTLEILGWNIDRPEWSEYHFSLKAGPNGQAMMGSIHDAHHLTSEHLEDLRILGNSDDLLEKISSIKSNFSSEAWSDKYFWKDRGLRRKLSLVSDPEAKERVIAIFDYWSQTVLKPLHDSLIGFISRIPGDCTYNQQGSSEFLPSSGPYYSMDLHAATDRYPVKLQVAVLERLVGSKEYADAWERIMVGEPFSNPWGDPVYYGRGQPMGAYSSWAMFALCHHLTTRTAARLAGYNPAKWSNYALLGDDIVLTDPKVAEIYQQLMDQLGVSLSPSKTHVSDDTYEFAKRWYQAGIEISGMQLHGLSNCTRWHEAAEELISSLSRWSLSPLDMEPGSIPAFLRALGLRVRDSHKVRAFLHLPRKADTEEMQARKSEWLASCHFSEVFGCFDRRDLRRTFVLQTLAEVKTSVMEEGIQRVFTLGQKFLSDLVKDYSGELPDQRVLLDLPVVGSVRSQAVKLQETFDRLRSAYYDNDEDIVFNNIALAMSDPTRIMTKRSNKVVVISRASLVNKYKLWARNYISTRHHLLSDDGALPD